MKALVLIAALMIPAAAFANDGGVTGIKVQDLKFEKSVWHDGNETRSPLTLTDEETLEAKFSAGQVKELMKILPPVSSVIAKAGKHQKSLAIAAGEGYVSIFCADAELKEGTDMNDAVWTPVTPNCTISFHKYGTAVTGSDITDLFGDWSDLDVPRACKMK